MNESKKMDLDLLSLYIYIDLRFKIRIVLERKLLNNLNAIAIKMSRLLEKLGSINSSLCKFWNVKLLERTKGGEKRTIIAAITVSKESGIPIARFEILRLTFNARRLAF